MDTQRIVAEVDFLFTHLQREFTSLTSASVGTIDIVSQNKLTASTTSVFNKIAKICNWTFVTAWRACSEWEYLQGFAFSNPSQESDETVDEYQSRTIAIADKMRKTTLTDSQSEALAGQMFTDWKDYPDQKARVLPKDGFNVWSTPKLGELSPRLSFRTKEIFGHDRFSILMMSKQASSEAADQPRVDYIFQVVIEYQEGTQRLQLSISSSTHEKVLTHIFTKWQGLLLSMAECFELKGRINTSKNLNLPDNAKAYLEDRSSEMPTNEQSINQQPASSTEDLRTVIAQNNFVIRQNETIIKNQLEILKILKEIRDDYSA